MLRRADEAMLNTMRVVREVFGKVCPYCANYGHCPFLLSTMPVELKADLYRNGCEHFALDLSAYYELEEKGYMLHLPSGEWEKRGGE